MQSGPSYNREHSAAAARIQSTWRRHVARRNLSSHSNAEDDLSPLTAQDRWHEALIHSETKRGLDSAHQGHNDPKARWKRAYNLTKRLHYSLPESTQEPSNIETNIETKVLETQHWLELTDGKHRYGSNLKYYHRSWLESDTTDNFFKWLDHGEGKSTSLDECSRDQLESERIVYLSLEQRRNYLVLIGDKGLLHWAKDNSPVDTTGGLWRDAGDGQGIIKSDHSPPESPVGGRNVRRSSFDNMDEEHEAAMHYMSARRKSSNRLVVFLREHFTAGGLTERLLRKTVEKNTWIYVADKNLNLYVGIKDTGVFQHSSFTSGGQVVSAGLLTVRDGLLTSLSPLSGHYRTKVNSFKQFIAVLEERGADLHKVHVTKAEIGLWGVEKYNKVRNVKRVAVRNLKSPSSKPANAASNITSHIGTAAAKIQDEVGHLVKPLAIADNWKLEVLRGRQRN